MGSVVKGVASLFGGRKRRREERRTRRGFEAAERSVQNFDFNNPFAGLQGGSYDPGSFTAQQAKAAQLGPAEQAKLASLAAAQGYEAQGYTAGTTNVGGLLRGADTGLTNAFSNLQASTAAAEMQARETDQALAASQDLAAQAGTGAGGATALAAAAAKSKAGVAASIDQQVKQNERLRAQGEAQLQRAQLAQENLASKFDLGQQQFNVGQENKAAMFAAQAQNQAAKFGAQSANQFALSEFNAANQMNQFNARQNNQFALTQFGAANQFALANQRAQNQGQQFNIANQINADRFAVQTDLAAQRMAAEGDMRIQDREYARQQDTLNRRAGEFQAAKDARAQAKADLIGGIGGIVSAAMPGIGSLMGGGTFGEGYKN